MFSLDSPLTTQLLKAGPQPKTATCNALGILPLLLGGHKISYPDAGLSQEELPKEGSGVVLVLAGAILGAFVATLFARSRGHRY